MTFDDDTRGIAIPLTHTLTMAMTALLMLALLAGAGGFLNEQQDRTAYSQVQSISGDGVSSIYTLDDLNDTGERVSATLDIEYPATVGGQQYTLHLAPETGNFDTRATLYVNASGLSFPVFQRIQTDTPLRESRATGDDPGLELCHDPSGTAPRQYITLGGCS